MGSLFPVGVVIPAHGRILDIECGPGGWILDVGHLLPNAQLIGIDHNPEMTRHAQLFAHAEGLLNVQFIPMNILAHWDFEDQSIDFINARQLSFLLFPQDWPAILRESERILRPGAPLCLTELECIISSSGALEDIVGLMNQAQFVLNRSFSPNGKNNGITPHLRPLMIKAGFSPATSRAFIIDSSYGTDGYQSFLEEFLLRVHTEHQQIQRATAVSEGELKALYERALQEMQQEDFFCLSYYLSLWGHKPY